ncbi:transposase [Kitasatospora sp. NPDC004615]|uniref:transposase n=1 Tax=Kitasatospora sp. NPDC004615 TaxID=3364017 RepID=UPI003695355F
MKVTGFARGRPSRSAASRRARRQAQAIGSGHGRRGEQPPAPVPRRCRRGHHTGPGHPRPAPRRSLRRADLPAGGRFVEQEAGGEARHPAVATLGHDVEHAADDQRHSGGQAPSTTVGTPGEGRQLPPDQPQCLRKDWGIHCHTLSAVDNNQLLLTAPKTPHSKTWAAPSQRAGTALDDRTDTSAFGNVADNRDYVFHRHGRPPHPKTVLDRFHLLCDKAGVPRIALHDLRHLAASFALAANTPPPAISKTLRHRTLSTSAYIYAESGPKDSSRAIRSYLRRRGIRAVIPQPAHQAANRKRSGSRGGRPPAFDHDAYRRRNTVERCISKLKQWRGLATRYDKTATSYLAALHLAAIFIWSAR